MNDRTTLEGTGPDPADAAAPDAAPSDAAPPSRRRGPSERVVVGLLLVLLAGLAVSVGVAVVHRPATFCDQVAALPALRDHLTDGTPASGLEDYASQLDALAADAPSDAVRAAAGRLADYDRALAAMVSGTGTAAPVLEGGEGAADARAVLDREISQRC